jgi:hypothetical protein
MRSVARDRLPGAFPAAPIAGAVQVLLAHELTGEDASQVEEHAEFRSGKARRQPTSREAPTSASV